VTQIAIVTYPGFTGLDMIGPYEVLRNLPDAWSTPATSTAQIKAMTMVVWEQACGRPGRAAASMTTHRPGHGSSAVDPHGHLLRVGEIGPSALLERQGALDEVVSLQQI